MGTNYYFRNKKLHEAIIEARKAEKALQKFLGGHDQYESLPSYHTENPEGFHIGKSSSGWFFNMCIYPDMGIKDLSDWEKAWSDPNYEIVDEYDQIQTPKEMLDRILDRRGTVTPKDAERIVRDGGLPPNGDWKLSSEYGLFYNTGYDYECGKDGPYTLTATRTNFS